MGGMHFGPQGTPREVITFLSVSTGKRISPNHWTEFPMPADIIQRVHAPAGNPTDIQLTFGDRNNVDVNEGDRS